MVVKTLMTAVEVLSRSERRAHINKKMRISVAAGIRLLWLVGPGKRTVTVHALGCDPRILRADGDLDGEDVLPGFRLPLRDLFGPSASGIGGGDANGVAKAS